MPLLKTTNRNPVAAVLPPVPAPGGATPLAPAQGDHVFGDVVGVIETALKAIFGSEAGLEGRIAGYNPTLATVWTGLKGVDFGHGPQQPVVQRQGSPEPDEHAHMFGGYGLRLQWWLAEIVDTGFRNGVTERKVGGATRAWANQVKGAVNDLLANLVDETALTAFVQAPRTVRPAQPAQVRHPAISLTRAGALVDRLQGPGKAAAQAVLTRYATVPNAVTGLIDRLEGSVRSFDHRTNKWT